MIIDANDNRVDAEIQQVLGKLERYRDAHPNAVIDAKRKNSVSIRVRIIDPAFEGMDRVDREPEVWNLLKTLQDDVRSNITMLLLLAPSETETSMANLEFNDPIPSRI